MTKPAGVFLQILSLPFLFLGLATFAEPTGGNIFMLCLGAFMLWAGGRPARKQSD